MSFRAHHLFYLLAMLLLTIGYLTKDSFVLADSENFMGISGHWGFFIPSAILALLSALIYRKFIKSGRQINTWLVIVHFLLVTFGLLCEYVYSDGFHLEFGCARYHCPGVQQQ